MAVIIVRKNKVRPISIPRRYEMVCDHVRQFETIGQLHVQRLVHVVISHFVVGHDLDSEPVSRTEVYYWTRAVCKFQVAFEKETGFHESLCGAEIAKFFEMARISGGK